MLGQWLPRAQVGEGSSGEIGNQGNQEGGKGFVGPSELTSSQHCSWWGKGRTGRVRERYELPTLSWPLQEVMGEQNRRG